MPEVSSKRRKRSQSRSSAKLNVSIKTEFPSRIFSPFRSIGYVANHVPFDIRNRGKQYLVATCCAKLNLLFVTSRTKYDITAIVSHGDHFFAANGNVISAFKRGKEDFRLNAGNTGVIKHIIIFGDFIVAATDRDHLVTWKIKSRGIRHLRTPSKCEEIHSHVGLKSNSQITVLEHPSTYLNKIILGKSDGTFEIWNIKTGKLRYRSQLFGKAVTAICQSPVVDIMGIGLQDGSIIVHQIKADQTLMRFKQEEYVTSISFRTDGHNIMASSNSKGDISLWNLQTKKINHTFYNAHNGEICRIYFLNGQPLLLSSGTDNSLQEWIFDSLDGTPRLLRSRGGHHAPPSKIRYYGADAHYLLSASKDRSLRGFSAYRDSQSQELSQGSLHSKSKSLKIQIDELKLGEIINVASCPTREKDWDNILTAHKNDTAARTWNWSRKVMGKHAFKTNDKTPVSAVALSLCGNFGFVGSAGGIVDVFNMQSGIHRKCFNHVLDGHSKGITGIVADSLTKVVITSSLDRTVKFWEFKTGTLIKTITFPAAVNLMQINQSSELIAVASDDLSLRVIDTETFKCVRELWGHQNRITDFTFSSDGRWLISASLDSTIRTWDLPTGHLIDAFKVPTICTSLDFSQNAEFLATTHIDSLGINLWTNRAQFKHVSTRHLSESEIAVIELPSISGENGIGTLEAAFETPEDKDDNPNSFQALDQLASGLLTLSLVPRSRWQSLLHLDVIKQRNKPKEPPKAPEKAPFFLPSLRDTQLGLHEKNQKVTPTKELISLNSTVMKFESKFTELLRLGAGEDDYTFFLEHLKTLSASSADFEIRSLNTNTLSEEFQWFVSSLTRQLRNKRDYELIQAWMAVFLKAHGDIIMTQCDVNTITTLEDWMLEHEKERARLSKLAGYCRGVIGFMRGQ
ncbi:U3 small nucleolar RNA-associated protein 21 [Neolecta irregularis DAH-3]|uniref:U3 small nucleolar RNA-associated protein 21 n=1 Tax=Neolecta irregularis (strain DAH-3) TaxID=1198029 RepID=A0A1U7LIW4_NEOID|nr:U3 small nucleolar RNA-associated protein 21 [Neolecta irregularis DAH-3]|eukprot:OLL22595.1 U3 small nucleolar RNA-associated protein 21 [Neolecta irregularis DAH-3]